MLAGNYVSSFFFLGERGHGEGNVSQEAKVRKKWREKINKGKKGKGKRKDSQRLQGDFPSERRDYREKRWLKMALSLLCAYNSKPVPFLTNLSAPTKLLAIKYGRMS